ncbi:hypothetical protein [Paraburkholderia bannensis]|uniref:hypothetical protein n=1 Tax=Paraburkholderia bannensis TaxID=765414 RepID=UPI00048592FF|nr:hypothetical protein [Paraburkholderia bannensis]
MTALFFQRFLRSHTRDSLHGGMLLLATALMCCAMSSARADCRPTGAPGAVQLSLAPAHIVVPKNAADGSVLGNTHAGWVQDIPFTCSGPGNTRELRVDAPPAVDASGARLHDVYATGVAGLGMRIVTRGGSFAGIDDGPRNAAYRVPLPPHADRLTGFAIDVQFVKTGPVTDGELAPGKIADVMVGGTTLVDIGVPADGIVVATAQCAPVNVSGEVSTGIGTMGAFSQEAVVIGTGCGNAGVSVALGVEQGYVYGAHRALNVDVPAAKPRSAAASASADFGAVINARPGVSRTRNTALAGNSQSDFGATGNDVTTGSAWATGGNASGGQGGFGSFGGARR